MEQIKNTLINEANNSKYGGQIDRSDWTVAVAKKDIIQRGVLCLKKGEQVYLEKNLGGVNTSRYASEFQI